MRITSIVLVLIVFFSFSTMGCVKKQPLSPSVNTATKESERASLKLPDTPAVKPSGDIIHTVKFPGENLGRISLWYTGDFGNWSKVIKYNPKLDLHKLQIGDKIKIPQGLIVNRQPFPKSALTAVLKNTNAEKPLAGVKSQQKKEELKETNLSKQSTQEKPVTTEDQPTPSNTDESSAEAIEDTANSAVSEVKEQTEGKLLDTAEFESEEFEVPAEELLSETTKGNQSPKENSDKTAMTNLIKCKGDKCSLKKSPQSQKDELFQ